MPISVLAQNIPLSESFLKMGHQFPPALHFHAHGFLCPWAQRTPGIALHFFRVNSFLAAWLKRWCRQWLTLAVYLAMCGGEISWHGEAGSGGKSVLKKKHHEDMVPLGHLSSSPAKISQRPLPSFISLSNRGVI